jgi:hypothetical protein
MMNSKNSQFVFFSHLKAYLSRQMFWQLQLMAGFVFAGSKCPGGRLSVSPWETRLHALRSHC